MGNVENSASRRAKRRNLRKIILRLVETSMLVGQGLHVRTIPATLRITDALYFERNDGGTVARSKRQMIASGLLRERNGLLYMTQKGNFALRQMEAAAEPPAKPRRWDGRWRLLIFDIPEQQKPMREKIRRTLIHIGFVRLQDSVWIYPYDCEDFINLLKTDLKIGKAVLYAIVDELEDDAHLKKQFGLK